MRVIALCFLAIGVGGLAGCGPQEAAKIDMVPAGALEDHAGLEGFRPVARPEDATQVAAGEVKSGALGTTIATLDATEPGVWLRTPLVDRQQSGTIVFGGNQLAVTLIPIDGPETAGSFISLDAMRQIGAPLTGFPELTVYGS